MSRTHRTPLLLTAAAAGALLLAGCGGTTAATDAAAPVEVAPAAATEGAVELADGLLPAEVFAPGATVTPVSADQLSQAMRQAAGHHSDHAADAAGGAPTVTPDSCVTAVQAAYTALGGADSVADVEDAAGQYARTGFAGTAELLTTGGPVEAVVGTLTDAVAACTTATVSSAEGTAVVTFGPVGAPALGDAAATVPVSATLTRAAGGAPVTASGVLGVVQDGDRLLTLVQGGVAAATDQASFDELLRQAAEHAADTLD